LGMGVRSVAWLVALAVTAVGCPASSLGARGNEACRMLPATRDTNRLRRTLSQCENWVDHKS